MDLPDSLLKKINSYLLPNETYKMILNKYTNVLFHDLVKIYALNSKIFNIFQSTSGFHMLTGHKDSCRCGKICCDSTNIHALLFHSALSGYTRLSPVEYTLVKKLAKTMKKHIKISNDFNFKYKFCIYGDLQTHPTSHIYENLYRFHIYLQK